MKNLSCSATFNPLRSYQHVHHLDYFIQIHRSYYITSLITSMSLILWMYYLKGWKWVWV